ncbi:MAG: M48 family metallopeptidase [Nitrospinae bacterium]|nr:M48 family metallopeptidase [Nitrospinota bacterium]
MLLLLAACSTTPITGRKQLMLVGTGQENALGLEAYREVLRKEPITQDPRVTEPVRRIVSRLAAVADRRDFRWEVSVIKKDKMANAFVLPGGKIAVYTGIFSIAQTEAGLAIILGHEVGHAIARHGGERMSQQLGVKAVGAALELGLQSSPYGNSIMAAYGVGSQVGFLLPYSRVHESEADRIGMVLAAKAGYDPRIAIDVWKRMAALPGTRPPEFLSTHPNTETRIEDIRQFLPQAIAQFRPHPDAGDTLLPTPEQVGLLR